MSLQIGEMITAAHCCFSCTLNTGKCGFFLLANKSCPVRLICLALQHSFATAKYKILNQFNLHWYWCLYRKRQKGSCQWKVLWRKTNKVEMTEHIIYLSPFVVYGVVTFQHFDFSAFQRFDFLAFWHSAFFIFRPLDLIFAVLIGTQSLVYGGLL